jgi:uncharacterized membrane protein (DUF106 family)
MWTFNSLLGKAFAILILPFRSLNPWWAMLLVSLLTGLLMLIIFKYTSNQAGIRRTKDRIKAHILEMRLYQDSLAVSFKAQGGILRANLKYMSHSLKPLAVMIVPVLLILIQLNFWFGYASLKTDQPTLLKLKLKENVNPMELDARLLPAPGLNIETPALRIEEENEIDWRISFREKGSYSLAIQVGTEQLNKKVEVAQPALSRLSPRRVDQSFWDQLFYPTEPPLDKASAVQRIEVKYASTGLPLLGWRMHWLIAFFILSVLFGFALKGVFGVEI